MTVSERRIASAKKQAVHNRNYRRARDRALVRLAHAYPDTYKQLLEMEKAFDEQQGKKWITIDGDTRLSVGIRTRANGVDSFVTSQADSSNGEQNQGNSSGEA